ncbi:MAG: UbiD family decarboxylase [Chloroflexi bacterium]|nr:UbiD family decarboxylase [Chloroflexota bacterium]
MVSLDLIADRLGAMLDLGTPSSFGSLVGQAMSLFTALRTTSSKRAPQDYRSLSAHEWASQFSSAARAGRPASLLAALVTSRHMASAVVDVSGEAMLIESASALTAGDRIAIVFGGDPAFILATLTPLPDLVHRSYFASWLRERPIETMRLADIDVDLPSNAEAVVSGTVSDVVRGNSIRLLDPMSLQVDHCRRICLGYAQRNIARLVGTDRYTVLEGLFIVFAAAAPNAARVIRRTDPEDSFRHCIGIQRPVKGPILAIQPVEGVDEWYICRARKSHLTFRGCLGESPVVTTP